MRAVFPISRSQLLSASGLALATALVSAGPAIRAQSFQATPTATFGSVTINTSPTTTAITVSSPSAVINWTPTDTAPSGGPIIFQTSGTTATFSNGVSGPSDYAVLNRIIPTGSNRPIQFNGVVISQIVNPAVGSQPGGTVFFYSPGGILIGSSAIFNVGNLVLTTSDVAFDAAGNFDTAGSYVFQPATVAGSQVAVAGGAQITAPLDGSYVALVAPTIVNSGTIEVNGSAALVAADAATITFSPGGLFDIEVTSGSSSSGLALLQTGTITGPAASGINVHRIYMVAVPKNDALTMAIATGSSLGFDIAGAADVDGNAIILSAGRDVIGGNVQFGASAGGGSGTATIIGSDGFVSSALEAHATGGVQFGSESPDGLTFASDVFMRSTGGSSILFADGAGFVNVAGNVQLLGETFGINAANTAFGSGADLLATNGGSVNIAGNAVLSASATGGFTLQPGTSGGDAVGSVARIEALNGSTISITGDAVLRAVGEGGGSQVGDAGGGNGFGGIARVTAAGALASNIGIGGSLQVDVSGLGGAGTGCVSCPADGGNGIGGRVIVSASDASTISVENTMRLESLGEGGSGLAGPGGGGRGGQIEVFAGSGGNLLLGPVVVNVSATGGDSAVAGGDAVGGSLDITTTGADGGGIRIFEAMNIFANASGGLGGEPGGIGGAAEGGQVLISVQDTTTFDMRGSLRANADALTTVGNGGIGDALGGKVTVEARDGGVLDILQNLELAADARGGFSYGGLTGGGATGGTAEVLAQNGAVVVQSSSFLTASGFGGDQFGNGSGGAGTGGLVRVSTGGSGSLSFLGFLAARSSGTGGAALSGPDATGGVGRGGEARITLEGGSITADAALEANADGFGGRGFAAGGLGEGGNTLIDMTGANFASAGITTFTAVGAGGETGFSIATGTAGEGKGGTVSLSADTSSAVLGALAGVTFDASAIAGTGLAPGNAQGGVVSIRSDASTIAAPGQLSAFADGFSGSDGIGSGDGGQGTGGSIVLTASGDSRGASVIDGGARMELRASGFGGSGASNGFGSDQAGNGGAGTGGLIRLNAAPDGGTIRAAELQASAQAFGGAGGEGDFGSLAGENGGNGGSAQGGQIIFGAVRGTGTTTGGHLFGSVLADVGATAGAGGNGGSGQFFGAPGGGGSATGGTIDLRLDAASSAMAVSTLLRLDANATGGSAGFCLDACAASGGDALGGTILLGSDGLTAGNTIDAQAIALSARGQGGDSSGATGGSGRGGNITAQLGSGMALSAQSLVLDAIGQGGADPVGLAGGAGLGGSAQVIGLGGSLIGIDGPVAIIADGEGGSSALQGGAGTGGTARLYSEGGAIGLGGSVIVRAEGTGGSANIDNVGSAGGTGTGGTALMTVGTPDLSGNNGSVTASGNVLLLARGNGGAGNAGGSGQGGSIGLLARQGTLDIGNLTAFAEGLGGAAGGGGSGGTGSGGAIQIFSSSSLAGPAQLSIGALVADAGASGGTGGAQPNQGDPTDPGGTGGAAFGGAIEIFGNAGNGRIAIATVAASALATGGNGGDALDGNGGAGGIARGGTIQLGMGSGPDTGTLNAGSASYGRIEALASALGGSGGSGNAASGSGGNGGAAFGGGVSLVVRGAPVTISESSIFAADAQGGDGGAGLVTGNGGDATISTLAGLNQISGAKLIVTSRLNQPAQSGQLDTGDLTFRASAKGGIGAVNGTSALGEGALVLLMSDSTFNGGNLVMAADAGTVAPGVSVDTISMTSSTANLSGDLRFSSPSRLSLSLDQSALTAQNVSISAGNWVLADQVPATPGILRAIDSLELTSGGDLAGHANLRSGGDLALVANGLVQFGTLTSPGQVFVRAGGRATLDDVSAGEQIDIAAVGPVIARNLAAATSVSVSSGGDATLGGITAGQSAASGNIFVSAGASALTGNLSASADVAVLAQQNITTGTITAVDALLLAGTAIAVERIGASGRVIMANRSMGPLNPAVPGGGLDKAQIFAAAPIATAGAIGVAQPSSAAQLRAHAGTTAAFQGFAASQGIGVVSGGNGSFGDLSSTAGTIELISRTGAIAVTGMNAALDVLVSGSGLLDLGTISARDVALLSRGDIQVADIAAGAVFNPASGALADATGRVLIGSATMLAPDAMPGAINYGVLMAATPIATSGSVTIMNAAAARRISTASTGSMSGGLFTAFDRIDVSTAATATVARRWTAPALRIVSADIAIIDNSSGSQSPTAPGASGIRTADGGSVELISGATGPLLLGDGLSGSGYALSNAEFGLISARRITIAGADSSANAIDMQVGRLDVTAGGVIGTSNLAGPNGTLILATGNADTLAPGGSIRVTGAISGTGFGTGNIMEFSTGRFELDAASGSIGLASSGTALGGIIEINAASIHVAAPDILARLAADPLYAGRIADLNAPATVQRPDGVLRALGLDLYPTGTLYIQNTGTTLNPAGFLADIAFSDITLPANAAPGSLAVIINGAFQTPTGIVEGFAAHDLILATATDLAQLGADSQINGCLFSAPVCRVAGDGPDVIGAISAQFQSSTLATLGDTPPMRGDPDGLLDEEDEQALVQMAEDGSAASSPIAPTVPLVNSAPLDAEPPIEQPVAGSGNPALIGSAPGGRGNEGEDR